MKIIWHEIVHLAWLILRLNKITLAYTHALVYTHAWTHVHLCMHTHIRMHTHTYTHACIHMHTHTRTHAYSNACTHIHTRFPLGIPTSRTIELRQTEMVAPEIR